MISLKDNILNLKKFTFSEFLDESLTWNNNTLTGIITEDSEFEMNKFSEDLIIYNDDNNIDLRIFDGTNDNIIYKQLEKFVIPLHLDHIFDYFWKEKINDGKDPEKFEKSKIIYENLLRNSIDKNFTSLVFISYTKNIKSLSKNAVEIALDYTYENHNNKRHIELRKFLGKYYILRNNIFYLFSNFEDDNE